MCILVTGVLGAIGLKFGVKSESVDIGAGALLGWFN